MFKEKKRILGITVFALLFLLILLPMNADAASEKSKGMSYETYKTSEGVVCIVKNTKKYAVELHAEMVFYNSSEESVGIRTDRNYCLESENSCVFFFSNPVDSGLREVSYKSYKINFSVEKISGKGYGTKSIKLRKIKTGKGISVTNTNTSKKKFAFVRASIVFYDSKNEVIGVSQNYLNCNKPKSKGRVTFSYPNDSDWNNIEPENYKIYVDYAYYYR